MDISRKSFLIGSVAAASAAPRVCAAATGQRPPTFAEPARDIPVDDWADVIVVGGGPAGVSAAVSAARAGAKVRLFELQGCLGGVWTAGLLTYIFDFDKSEIGWEIIRRLDAYGARAVDRPGTEGMKWYKGGLDKDWVYAPEYMKAVCEDMCVEAGVRVTLHCPVVAAYRDAGGRNVATVVTESKSGRRAWRARTFVDCSGDGDLGAQAGCGFDLGFGPEGWGQPATLNALVVVDDGDAVAAGDFVSNEPAMWTQALNPETGKPTCHHIVASHKLKAELRRAGLEPSYGDPTLFRFHRNLFCFMANHEYKLRIDDAQAVSDATVRARKEILALAAGLAKLSGPWKGFRVAATAEQIGHRDARRIHGRYTVPRARRGQPLHGRALHLGRLLRPRQLPRDRQFRGDRRSRRQGRRAGLRRGYRADAASSAVRRMRAADVSRARRPAQPSTATTTRRPPRCAVRTTEAPAESVKPVLSPSHPGTGVA